MAVALARVQTAVTDFANCDPLFMHTYETTSDGMELVSPYPLTLRDRALRDAPAGHAVLAAELFPDHANPAGCHAAIDAATSLMLS